MRMGVLLLAVSFAWTSPAYAHPLVDEARASYEEADFEAALDALTRAEASDDLDRDDLIQVYHLRILANLGMGDSYAVESDLRRLLSISPTYEFGYTVPPEVLEQATQMRSGLGGPMRVTVRASPGVSGLTIRASVENDPENLVRSMRIGTRRGSSTWRRTRGSSLELPGGARVEFYADAIGPGGAVMASDGSEAEPRVWEGDGSGSSVGLWIGIGVGAAALIAAVIIIVIFAGSSGQSSDLTNPTLPMVSFD